MKNDTNLIENIYSTANLATTDHVVNKVQEIKGVLPKLLNNSTKKNIVIGMLDVMGIDAQEVIRDADNREKALKTALIEHEEATTTAHAIDQQNIADLEGQIKKIKDGMSARAIEHTNKRSVINDERIRVKEVMKLVAH